MGDPTETEAPPRKPARTSVWGVLLGMGLVAALHTALFAFAAGFDAPRAFFLIGIVQIVYLAPAWLLLRRRGYRLAALGVVLAAALTFLLNGACFATFGFDYF